MRLASKFFAFALVLALGGCDRGHSPLEFAILHDDWQAVLAQTHEGKDSSVPFKLLRAHASIAVNHVNDAVCMFGSLSNVELHEWDVWTHAFVKAHPRRAVARYLRGDSLARQSQWDEALKEFDQALALDPKHALSLHARGVVRGLNDDVTRGMEDLRRAVELNPAFADALASQGFSYLQLKSADAAHEVFDAALKIDPDFALATAGRAYADLALGQWNLGNRDLQRAAELSACTADLLTPHIVQMAAWVDRMSGLASEEPGSSPGTQMDRHLQDLSAGKIGALSPIARTLGQNPELAGKVGQTLGTLKQQNPAIFKQITDRIQGGADWTKPNGGAETLLNGLKSVSGGIEARNPRTGVGGHIDLNPSPLLNQQLDKTRIDHGGFLNLQRLTGTVGPVGGVTTSLVAAHIDQGDWPVPPLDGLLYSAQGGGR